MTLITHTPTYKHKKKSQHSAKISATNMLINNDTYGEGRMHEHSLLLIQERNYQFIHTLIMCCVISITASRFQLFLLTKFKYFSKII